MTDIIHPSWSALIPILYQPTLTTLNTEILTDIKYYPEKENIFRVFKTPLEDVKVVILGQDPYPNPNDAIGLSFVNGTDKIPVSLRVIHKELEAQGFNNPNIHKWEEQGVFLLNTALTVEAGNAGSHLKYWFDFTTTAIKLLSNLNPCIWILWGRYAQSFERFIYKPLHVAKENSDLIKDLPFSAGFNFVLKSAHPAAEGYSGGKAGFYGNNHFIMANEILKADKKQEIIW